MSVMWGWGIFGLQGVLLLRVLRDLGIAGYFGPRVYPTMSVRGLSVGPSLNISETALRIFLIFCMMLVHHKGTKVTEPNFFKKNLGGSQMGENPPFWGIFDVFSPYLKNSSNDFDGILSLNSPH